MKHLIRSTVNSLVSETPQELEKVSFSRAVCVRVLFPLADTKENLGGVRLRESVMSDSCKCQTESLLPHRQRKMPQNRSPLFCYPVKGRSVRLRKCQLA